MSSAAAPFRSRREESLAVYALLGVWLGVIFIKSEVATWYRIQEMFRFQDVHMYGVLGSAVAVAAISVFLMKRLGVRTVRGDEIAFPSVEQTSPRIQHVLGGTAFGVGWGLLGACPGPMFALLGAGVSVMVVGLTGAVLGAWTYGRLQRHLPHG